MTAKGDRMITTHVTVPESLIQRLKSAHAKMMLEQGHMSFASAIRVVIVAGLRSLRK